MIDLILLRKEPAVVSQAILKKDPEFPVEQLIALDVELRKIRQEEEQLRNEKNELNDRAKQGITDAIRQQSIDLSNRIKEKEAEVLHVDQLFTRLYLSCPNIPFSSVPDGGKAHNQIVKTYKQPIEQQFEPKHHVELGAQLGWFDFDKAALMTASNFSFYKGDAVRLMYALTMFMIKHNIQHGYEPVLPPYLVNEQSLLVASNFPKFKNDVFALQDNLYLTPTAEVNLANVYRNAILHAAQLPIRMTAWTSCFRKEAGGYGAHERGLIRMHQFEKVELFTLCTPQESMHEHERMLHCAETILQKLDLHYRVSLLAAQDCSFASAKTYDIEVWLPGQKAYYEVSSISNCTDFQSRRGKIRYKPEIDSATELVHTLNGSSLALSRLMVAIIEVYQQADGSILIPEMLQKEGLWS